MYNLKKKEKKKKICIFIYIFFNEIILIVYGYFIRFKIELEYVNVENIMNIVFNILNCFFVVLFLFY